MGSLSANAKSFASRYFMGDRGIQIILEAQPEILGSNGLLATIYASIYPPQHTGGGKPCEPRLVLHSLNQRSYNSQWGSLLESGIYSFELFNTPSYGFGGFNILNADQGVDSWVEDYNWQNAPCKLLIGEKAAAFSAFEDLWFFLVRSNPDWVAQGSLSFDIKLPLTDWEQPMSVSTLGSSNRITPRLFGAVEQIKPDLINSATQQYEIENTNGVQSGATFITYEGGVDISAVTTFDAANGRFTLDGEPQYNVTADAESENASRRTYIHQVVADMLSEFSVTSNHVGTFSSFSDIGIWVNQENNFRLGPAINLALGPIGMWWIDADGTQVSFDRITSPEAKTASVDFLSADILNIEKRGNLPVIGHQRYLSTRYWEPPQTITRADSQFIARARDGGVWFDIAQTVLDFPDAISVMTPTAGNSISQADVDATVIFDEARAVYYVQVGPINALAAWIGDYISITTDKAPGFGSPKNLLVVGIELDFSARRVTLECFG